jgi:predicted phosphoribosyltransferase
MHFNQLQNHLFHNRKDAGRQLAQRLAARYRHQPNTLVLALPRGGVPVAHEIARALELPLDICLVRKIGVPGHAELAMGAIAGSGVRVLNQDIINQLGIQPSQVEQVTATESLELERRERVYRQGRSSTPLVGKTVILVDDGVATGATLRAAIAILKRSGVEKIVVAVPVAPPGIVAELLQHVDEVVIVITPERLQSISLWYDQFDQTSDETVKDILSQYAHSATSGHLDHSPGGS